MATRKKHPAQEDFRKFVYMVWKHLGLPDPTPVQYDIAHYLQHGPTRSVIEAFRGVGKSWLTAAFVCWLLWNDPQLKILVVSASKDRADLFSMFVKRLIADMPELQHLQARPGQLDSMLKFDVGPATPDQSPSVKSAGITGQITGSRADIIVADDIEVPNNSATQVMRDKLSEAVKEFDAILKPLPTARIIYLGTPQCEMSLYNQLPERGYEVRVWPAEYPQFKDIIKYQGRLAPIVTKALEKDSNLQGRPLDPQRFGEEDLAARKLSYGRAGYALQFMLDTSLSDADRYPLKIADLMVMNLSPMMGHLKLAWGADPSVCINELPAVALLGDRYYRPIWKSPDMSEYTGCVMAIDPSGRGQDETGYAIIKILASTLYVVAAGGLKGGYEDSTLETLAKLAAKHKVNHIIIEANFGDGMYTKLFQPVLQKHHKCLVEEVKHSTQKEARIIDTLEPVMSSHRLVVDQKVIEDDYRTAENDIQYSLFYQMTRLSRDRGSLAHDDRLDALAMAVAYWTEHLAADSDKQAEAIRERALEDELKKFVSGVLGGKPRDPNWHNSNAAHR